jgi:hypothetical protein
MCDTLHEKQLVSQLLTQRIHPIADSITMLLQHDVPAGHVSG